MRPSTDVSARGIAEDHGEALVNRPALMLRSREATSSNIGSNIAPWSPTFVPAAVSRVEQAFQAPLAVHATPVGGAVKRAFDITIAFTTLLLMMPLMILITLLIYASMGGPVFFVQRRVGFNRRDFGCLKFRTMVPDADERLRAHLATHPDAARAWSEAYKLKNDPRITPLGQILRKSSLDELPQLFNILIGDMSCIGPRPVIADELERYGPYQREYLRAKPGLTGMWQVNGRSNTTYTHRVNCDRYYVRRWSLFLDFAILFKTIPAILKFDQTA